eukprot:6181826-Pleurochrysis_carterae.AAC.2
MYTPSVLRSAGVRRARGRKRGRGRGRGRGPRPAAVGAEDVCGCEEGHGRALWRPPRKLVCAAALRRLASGRVCVRACACVRARARVRAGPGALPTGKVRSGDRSDVREGICT